MKTTDATANENINARLAAIDAAIAVQERIIDTYEGMISYCNNGDGADDLFLYLGKAEAEKARLEREWNTILLATEVV